MDNIEALAATESSQVSKRIFNFYNIKLFIMLLAGVLIVLNIVDYKIKPLLDEIAQLKNEIAQTPTLKVINTRDLATHFSMVGYDTRTQLEYMDILKILLDKSRIIAVNEDALLFKSPSNELKINHIDALRAHLKQLGIENPRVINEELYIQREQQQKELLDRLTGQTMGQ
ncbi:hypothetical protein [Shewanella morhuae]|uniref:Uncharacterized protein n=1 Tax=Shewanella morhuae TaxID=365591 RepID=A0A380C242_9GAMM|nr:hypothetical protein [Shewanella morhuae]SUJ10228.1 Uncharacterised protein [Shewanella morhuae]